MLFVRFYKENKMRNDKFTLKSQEAIAPRSSFAQKKGNQQVDVEHSALCTAGGRYSFEIAK